MLQVTLPPLQTTILPVACAETPENIFVLLEVNMQPKCDDAQVLITDGAVKDVVGCEEKALFTVKCLPVALLTGAGYTAPEVDQTKYPAAEIDQTEHCHPLCTTIWLTNHLVRL